MILILMGLGGITYAVVTAYLDYKKEKKKAEKSRSGYNDARVK